VLDATGHRSEQHGSNCNRSGPYKLSEQPQAFWIVCPRVLAQELMLLVDELLEPHSVQL
jgi:hypothetical protein